MFSRSEVQIGVFGRMGNRTGRPIHAQTDSKIEQICVRFDDNKQEVYNLVQATKTLFLYTQTEK